MYKYDLVDHVVVQLEYVISITNLSYNVRNDTYKLEESDYNFFFQICENFEQG